MSYLDRLFAPSLWSPRQIPLEPVEIDWAHPLAGGLVCLIVPGGAAGVADLTGNAPVLTAQGAAQLVAGNYGPGGAVPSASGGGWIGPANTVPTALQLGANLTIFAKGGYLGTTTLGAVNPVVFGVVLASSPYGGYLLGTSGTTAPEFFCSENSGAFISALGEAGDMRPDTLLAGILTPTTITFWSPINSDTQSYSGAPYYGGGYIALGDPIANARSANFRTDVCGIYDYSLPTDLLTWLNAEPFAMLRPTRRISYGFVLPSGNSTVGLASIGPIAASGQTIATDVASGLAKIGPIATSGQVAQTNQAAGIASLGPVKASGQLARTNVASGLISIGPIAAKGIIPDNAAGLAILGPIAAAATLVQTNPASAASAIGPVKAAGEIAQTDIGTGLASIGPIIASGELSEPGTVVGLAPIGSIVVTGEIAQTNPIGALASLEAISAVGSISQINVARGSAPLEIAVDASVTQTNPAIGLASIGLIKAAGMMSSGSMVGVCSLGRISVIASMMAVGPDFAWSVALQPENLSVALPPEMLSVALPPGD